MAALSQFSLIPVIHSSCTTFSDSPIMISLRSTPAFTACPPARRTVAVRASSMHSMNDFGNERFSAASMGLLSKRIAELNQEQQLNSLLDTRPPVPSGTQMMMWEEMLMDHSLLCNWHEQAWRSLEGGGGHQQQPGQQQEASVEDL